MHTKWISSFTYIILGQYVWDILTSLLFLFIAVSLLTIHYLKNSFSFYQVQIKYLPFINPLSIYPSICSLPSFLSIIKNLFIQVLVQFYVSFHHVPCIVRTMNVFHIVEINEPEIIPDQKKCQKDLGRLDIFRLLSFKGS